MTRGFITIATGKEQYYKIAANLVRSYRFFSADPLPFAVITEERNQYTELFDDIILTQESTHSFMDKFLLLKYCPYDETIFIDADSLCYGDLNYFWKLFENATDFSAFGINADLHDDNAAWYRVEDIWKYGEQISYKCRMHAGVIFLRKTEKLQKMYKDCVEIYSNYDKLYFHTCPSSCDECVFGIAMPMNQMETVPEDFYHFACVPFVKAIQSDMFLPRLSYLHEIPGFVEDSILLHFGTFYTYGPQYRFDTECLNIIEKKERQQLNFWELVLYKYRLRYYCLCVSYEFVRFFKRVINKLLRQHKDI